MNLEYNEITKRVEIELANRTTIEIKGDTSSEQHLLSINVLEELSYLNNNPLGKVSSNECEIELYDITKDLIPSNVNSKYKGLLDNSAKFRVYASVDGVETELGEYYVTDWQSDQDINSFNIRISGTDLIGYLREKSVKLIPVNENTSVAEYYKLLFEAVGLQSSQYSISSTLSQNFKFSVISGNKFGDIVNTVAEGTVTCVFTDRQGVIHVEDALWSKNNVGILSGSVHIFKGKLKNNGLSDYNGVVVKYKEVSKSELSELLAEVKGYKLLNSRAEIKGIKSEKAIYCVDYVDIQNSNNVGLIAECTDVDYTQNSIDLIIETQETGGMIIDISVYGKKIEETDCEIKRDIQTGKSDNSLEIDNVLIQSKEYADWYINKLTEYIKSRKYNLVVRAKCTPTITLGDKITVKINNADIDGEYKVLSNKIEFTAGCTCELLLTTE